VRINLTHKCVCVEWLDAKVNVDGEMPELPLMKSYGVIIYKGKDKVCIASLLGTNSDPRIITAIPRSLIKKIISI